MSRIIKESAIILRTFDFSESSLIAVSLTGGHGKIRILAKGAKRERSPFQGVLRTGNIAEIVYYDKGGEGLRTLREAAVVSTFDTDRADLDRICLFQAGLEVVDRATPERGADEGVFSILEDFVRSIGSATDPWVVFFRLEAGILAMAGLFPMLDRCPVCEKDLAIEGVRINPSSGEVMCQRCGGEGMLSLSSRTRKILSGMAGASPAGPEDEKMDRESRREAGRLLHNLLVHHMEGYRLPNALKILKGVD